eukprot:jgi/Bigna1/79118/fgenesh1_pg.59_\
MKEKGLVPFAKMSKQIKPLSRIWIQTNGLVLSVSGSWDSKRRKSSSAFIQRISLRWVSSLQMQEIFSFRMAAVPVTRFPSELLPHACTWMAYPWKKSEWGSKNLLQAAQEAIVRIAKALSDFEHIRMLVAPKALPKAKQAFAGVKNIELIKGSILCNIAQSEDYDDIWLRDTGCVFVYRAAQQNLPTSDDGSKGKKRHSNSMCTHQHYNKFDATVDKSENISSTCKIEEGTPEIDSKGAATEVYSSKLNEEDMLAVDLNFNGWGEKCEHKRDKKVASFIATATSCERCTANIVMEGGGIEMDGEGSALMTISNAFHPKRSRQYPRWTEENQKGLESEIHRLFGVAKVIWLQGHRHRGDVTDGHIDAYARLSMGPLLIIATGRQPPDGVGRSKGGGVNPGFGESKGFAASSVHGCRQQTILTHIYSGRRASEDNRAEVFPFEDGWRDTLCDAAATCSRSRMNI